MVCRDSVSSPYILEGITSYGRGCADSGFPGVYTEVSYYADWIIQHINSSSKFTSIFLQLCDLFSYNKKYYFTYN